MNHYLHLLCYNAARPARYFSPASSIAWHNVQEQVCKRKPRPCAQSRCAPIHPPRKPTALPFHRSERRKLPRHSPPPKVPSPSLPSPEFPRITCRSRRTRINRRNRRQHVRLKVPSVRNIALRRILTRHEEQSQRCSCAIFPRAAQLTRAQPDDLREVTCCGL